MLRFQLNQAITCLKCEKAVFDKSRTEFIMLKHKKTVTNVWDVRTTEDLLQIQVDMFGDCLKISKLVCEAYRTFGKYFLFL